MTIREADTACATAPLRLTGAAIQVPAYRQIIWLLPIAYALHIAEESIGNFPGWVTHSIHGSFSDAAFVINNVVFMTILLTLASLNFRRTTPVRATALLVCASANLFWDGLFHVFATAALNVYSPGLITAALLYIPISLLLATAVLTQHIVAPRRLVLAALAGLALFGFVVWSGLFQFAT